MVKLGNAGRDKGDETEEHGADYAEKKKKKKERLIEENRRRQEKLTGWKSTINK